MKYRFICVAYGTAYAYICGSLFLDVLHSTANRYSQAIAEGAAFAKRVRRTQLIALLIHNHNWT